MGTLYEITKQIEEVIENGFSVNEETGELFDDTDLEALDMDFKTKADNIACFIKNLNAEAKAIREEENALASRRRAKESKAAKLKEYLEGSMFLLQMDKLETSRNKLSFRKSTRLLIGDEAEIPTEFIKTEYKPDKQALTKALKEGQEFTGIALVEQKNLQVK